MAPSRPIVTASQLPGMSSESMIYGVTNMHPCRYIMAADATKSAKATLHGLLTEAQMQNALQRAMHNSKSKYEKNIIW